MYICINAFAYFMTAERLKVACGSAVGGVLAFPLADNECLVQLAEGMRIT